jgi:anti-sigma factor RsiW
MTITRHNYEEYFLLYADNELSAEKRREVEAFMEANPDLAGELDLFHQLRLEPETPPVFLGKETLFRQASEEVGEEDSLLISYLDNELTAVEKTAAERRIAADPRLSKLLEQYRSAVLPAESIPFPDKSSLYRREEQPARILYMRWIRMAVAAAVVLAGGLLWYIASDRAAADGSQSPVAGTQIAVSSQRPETTGNGQPTIDGQSPIQEKLVAAANAQPITQNPQQFATYPVTKSSPIRNHYRSNEAVNAVAIGEKPAVASNHLPTPVTNAIPEETGVGVTASSANPVPDAGKALIIDRPSIGTETKSDYATEALMNIHPTAAAEITDDESGRNRKGPFRGWVRKANRFLNKAANPDPDKPTVKVASFEIALGR